MKTKFVESCKKIIERGTCGGILCENCPFSCINSSTVCSRNNFYEKNDEIIELATRCLRDNEICN